MSSHHLFIKREKVTPTRSTRIWRRSCK